MIQCSCTLVKVLPQITCICQTSLKVINYLSSNLFLVTSDVILREIIFFLNKFQSNFLSSEMLKLSNDFTKRN